MGSPSYDDRRTLTVVIVDIDDNPPRFDRTIVASPHQVYVLEEHSGVAVANVALATDPDVGNNSHICYYIVGKLRIVVKFRRYNYDDGKVIWVVTMMTVTVMVTNYNIDDHNDDDDYDDDNIDDEDDGIYDDDKYSGCCRLSLYTLRLMLVTRNVFSSIPECITSTRSFVTIKTCENNYNWAISFTPICLSILSCK